MTQEAAQTFETHRRLLEGIAYRMLGSLAEAQDVVQDTFLRWNQADREQVENSKAWLVTTCSRIALDVLKSARVRRLEYVGPWLPEPYLEQGGPADGSPAEVDDTVSTALMLALETMSPAERAAFLLHDVFGYDFREIGEILGKTAPACRKLASRARERVQSERPRFSVSPVEHRHLLAAFLEAARAGEMDALKGLLVASVEFHSDGGGKVSAAKEVLVGAEVVARFFSKVIPRPRGKALETRLGWFNGAPGALVIENGQVISSISLEIDSESGKITRIFALRNPDKLVPFQELA